MKWGFTQGDSLSDDPVSGDQFPLTLKFSICRNLYRDLAEPSPRFYYFNLCFWGFRENIEKFLEIKSRFSPHTHGEAPG